jgi:hypothetical protein
MIARKNALKGTTRKLLPLEQEDGMRHFIAVGFDGLQWIVCTVIYLRHVESEVSSSLEGRTTPDARGPVL